MAANAKSSVLESPFTFCDKKKVVCHKSSVYGSCIRTNGDVNAVVTITLLFPDHLKEWHRMERYTHTHCKRSTFILELHKYCSYVTHTANVLLSSWNCTSTALTSVQHTHCARDAHVPIFTHYSYNTRTYCPRTTLNLCWYNTRTAALTMAQHTYCTLTVPKYHSYIRTTHILLSCITAHVLLSHW
jgi:hypothetical protein